CGTTSRRASCSCGGAWMTGERRSACAGRDAGNCSCRWRGRWRSAGREGRGAVVSCPAMVEVTVLPNRSRPGIGLPPARVAQRPWLPQHARLCPVLEAGSALGYLVYPPLRLDEALQILYANSKYQVSYFREGKEGKKGQWDEVFQLTFSLSIGGGSYNAELAVKE